MVTVGVRELKNRLSHYLRRVRAGERVVVTDRGKSIAVMSPPAETVVARRLEAMLREGVARWEGGKPKGSRRPPRISGPSVSQAVIEDRR